MENKEGGRNGEKHPLLFPDPGRALFNSAGLCPLGKVNFRIQDEMAQKPYRLGWHVAIWLAKGNTLGPRHIADNPH